jgi:hypothetical protein
VDGPDSDSDGVPDASDNCVDVPNADQHNSNPEPLPLPPPMTYGDATNATTSVLGDACNPDIDGDRLADDNEAALGADPALPDTDADSYLDGAEVVCGSDPAEAGSRPTGVDEDFDTLPDACEEAAGTTLGVRDSDGDGIVDGMEFLRIGTDPSSPDTDGDGCADGTELASVNGDPSVTSIDLGQVAQRFAPGFGDPNYMAHFDVNKDRLISSLDLQFIAQRFGHCF